MKSLNHGKILFKKAPVTFGLSHCNNNWIGASLIGNRLGMLGSILTQWKWTVMSVLEMALGYRDKTM